MADYRQCIRESRRLLAVPCCLTDGQLALRNGAIGQQGRQGIESQTTSLRCGSQRRTSSNTRRAQSISFL